MPENDYITNLKVRIGEEVEHARKEVEAGRNPEFHWGVRDGLREALRLLGVRDVP